MSTQDELLLRRCFALAKRAQNYTFPNPLVGSLLIDDAGNIIAEAWHRAFGHAHAEAGLLHSLPNGIDYSRTTLYVSLEPCCHINKKTPPCAQLIIQKKIPCVVVATLDPNPNVAGKGIQLLQQAGIEVRTYHDTFFPLQKQLNPSFFINQTEQKPMVTLKWAESRNKIIGDTQERLMVSHTYSQFFTHALRAQHQAILIGRNTALIDKPQLNLRFALGKDPVIILMDTSAQILPHKFFPNRKVLIINSVFEKKEDTYEWVRFADLQDWNLILQTLYEKHHIGSILVEGGAQVLQTLIHTDQWHQAFILQSSKTLQTNQPVFAPTIYGNYEFIMQIASDTIFRIINSCQTLDFQHPFDMIYGKL